MMRTVTSGFRALGGFWLAGSAVLMAGGASLGSMAAAVEGRSLTLSPETAFERMPVGGVTVESGQRSRGRDLMLPLRGRPTTRQAEQMQRIEERLRLEVAVREPATATRPSPSTGPNRRPRDVSLITRWMVERTRRVLETARSATRPAR